MFIISVMQVAFVLVTMVKLTFLRSTSLPLTGSVCLSRYPVERYQCCKDTYVVDNVCIDCPPGFHGTNCSKTCPHGYYGRKCLSECKCSGNEVCNRMIGCTDIIKQDFSCEEENCNNIEQRRQFSDKSTLQWPKMNIKTATELTTVEVLTTKYSDNSFLLPATLGSTIFILFLLCVTLNFVLRRKTNGCLLKVSPGRRSVAHLDRDGDQPCSYDGTHVEHTYADVRVSRMLPESSISTGALGHSNENQNISRRSIR